VRLVVPVAVGWAEPGFDLGLVAVAEIEAMVVAIDFVKQFAVERHPAVVAGLHYLRVALASYLETAAGWESMSLKDYIQKCCSWLLVNSKDLAGSVASMLN